MARQDSQHRFVAPYDWSEADDELETLHADLISDAKRVLCVTSLLHVLV